MIKIRMITISWYMNVRNKQENVFSDTTCEIVQIISKLIHYCAKVMNATIIKIRSMCRHKQNVQNNTCANHELTDIATRYNVL